MAVVQEWSGRTGLWWPETHGYLPSVAVVQAWSGRTGLWWPETHGYLPSMAVVQAWSGRTGLTTLCGGRSRGHGWCVLAGRWTSTAWWLVHSSRSLRCTRTFASRCQTFRPQIHESTSRRTCSTTSSCCARSLVSRESFVHIALEVVRGRLDTIQAE